MQQKEMTNCFISIGSNMDDRLKNISEAIALIDNDLECVVHCCSPIYKNEAMYNLNLDYFYNSVIRIDTLRSAWSLLSILKEIEIKLGRKNQKTRYCARPIDLDILTYGKHVIESEELTIPHLHIKERNFVLKPWSDIDSDYVLPDSNMNISQLLNQVSVKSMSRVD